jgi:DNA helicase-2/ATP-dependent DNA helicase PcrA
MVTAEGARRTDTRRARPSDEQLAAITAPEGPLLIVAGPGSGKTNTIAERIAYLVRQVRVPPAQVIAFSFTRVAAETLRARLVARLGLEGGIVTVTTFHAFGTRVIARWSAAVGYGGRRPRRLPEEAERPLLLEALRCHELGIEAPPERVLRALEEAVRLVRLGEGDALVSETTVALAAAYEALLRERNAVDFLGMLALPLRLLQDRPEILRRYQAAYRHVLVDEMQDLNTAQYRIARLLAQQHGCLTAVGDPAQTLYGFAGASERFLLDFPVQHPGTTTITLSQNFRSSGNIVDATNVIGVPLPYGRPLWTANPPGPDPVLYSADDDRDERGLVAAEIAALLRTGDVASRADIAVLYRLREQDGPLRRALKERGVPCGRDRGTSLEPRVHLGTVHGAKGEEWATVFIVGLEEAILPHRRALLDESPGALTTERHVAYVAVSRPRERLYLTHCGRRPEGGAAADGGAGYRVATPSRFLLALPVVRVAGPRRAESELLRPRPHLPEAA